MPPSFLGVVLDAPGPAPGRLEQHSLIGSSEGSPAPLRYAAAFVCHRTSPVAQVLIQVAQFKNEFKK
jgi:hypothetical protein